MSEFAEEAKKPQAGGDGAKLEDSNMAHIGSAEDKAARKAAAETEPAWQGCGDLAAGGVEVWRIEKFKVVPWPKEEYGSFYEGDSYIVLHTHQDGDSDKILWDIHFWLGKATTQDEMGTAAYKTVELDSLKDGLPVLHREVQGYESQAFQKLFDEIHYLEGGIESGFHHVEPGAYVARLFQIRKTKNTIKVTSMPCVRDSLNQGDCFVLDAGEKVYRWFGDSASPFEKQKCSSVAFNMVQKRAGRSHCVNEDDLEGSGFWELLGGEGDVKGADEAAAAPSEDVGEGVLYKLSDLTGALAVTEVARGDIKAAMLDSTDVFLLDAGIEVFVWVGSAASEAEKANAFETADNFMRQTDKPLSTPVHLFREGQDIKNAIWNKIMD